MKPTGLLARWGGFTYRFRWAVLAISVILLLLSVAALRNGGQLTSGGPISPNLQSARADQLLGQEIKATASSQSSFILLVSDPGLAVSDPGFETALEAAVAPLATSPHVKQVVTPYDAPAAQRAQYVSPSGTQALVVVLLNDPSSVAQHYYPALISSLHPGRLTIQATGEVPIVIAFNQTLESDLHRAEVISLPLTLLMLLVIFASAAAAALPLGVGLLAIAGGGGATLLIARFTDVSQYALNIVTLIGLAVAIDYSLFIVSRFRDELALGLTPPEALQVTMASAGRAILFSGLTVAVGLAAMLFFQGTFLASMGVSGALVVGIAVFYALTFLPAVLAVLGPRVGWLHLPFGHPRPHRRGIWYAWARQVMRRPLLFALPALALLLLAGVPFLNLRMASGNVDQLPTSIAARTAYDQLQRFPSQSENTYSVLYYYPGSSPLSASNLAGEWALTQRLSSLPGVSQVTGPLSLQPGMTLADYQRLYSQPPSQLPAQVQETLAVSVGPHLMLVQVHSPYAQSSDAARTLLHRLRAQRLTGGQVLVTGATAQDVDVINFILARTPWAVLFVVLVTYLVVFVLTGSVVLPLKAVVINMVSISASFGMLVWIFQEGHLSGLLDFTPQALDPTVPVLLFSIVFGMSMDYEVLLVSRIQEAYLADESAGTAVAIGLERSGRLITGAAAIMIAVFVAFGLAQVLVIKSIGLGLAIAVTLDATVVRLVLVPSVMRLLGDWAWWAPAPLRRFAVRLQLAEHASNQPDREAVQAP